MHLAVDTIPSYLLQKGILSPRDILSGRWAISQSDGSHPVYRILNGRGEGWVLKQPHVHDRHHISLLDREAAFFSLADHFAWARPLGQLLPKLYLYDRGVHGLMMEHLPYDNGLEHLRREQCQPEVMGKLLGQAFAKLHIPVPNSYAAVAMLQSRLPWILQMNSVDAMHLDQPVSRELLELIRKDSFLPHVLNSLEKSWEYQSIVHIDSKLDNVLVHITNKERRAWVIDWAQAGVGDPAWDIGNLMHSALMLWFYGIPFKREDSLAVNISKAVYPLETAQDFSKALVSAYVEAREFTPGARKIFIERAFRYMGAALVQAVLTDARSMENKTYRQLAVIQMASRILEDPADTIEEFMTS